MRQTGLSVSKEAAKAIQVPLFYHVPPTCNGLIEGKDLCWGEKTRVSPEGECEYMCMCVYVFMCMNGHTCMSVSMCVLVCEGVNMYV